MSDTTSAYINMVDVKALKKELAADLSGKFNDIGQELISHKLAEQNILQQSAANGGPSTSADALFGLIRICKMGIREIAVEAKMSRKKVAGMMDRTLDVTQDFSKAVERIAKRKKPEWYK